MLSIFETEPAPRPQAPPAQAAPRDETPEIPPAGAEFEIVLGRAQVASWLFVAVIAMAVCISLAYLAGKAASPGKAAAAAQAAASLPTAASSAAGLPAATSPGAGLPAATFAAAAMPTATSSAAAMPAATSPAAGMPAASIVVPPKADLASLLKNAGKSGPPLFAEPEAGKVYIQIGAVEKGMATILAEGLRSHGFDAFVGAGPSEKIFRVLIGPLPNPESFRQAKAAVDAIDLTAFARRYEK